MASKRSSLPLALTIAGALAMPAAPTSQAASLRPDISAGVERALDRGLTPLDDGILEIRGSRASTRSRGSSGSSTSSSKAPAAQPEPGWAGRTIPDARKALANRGFRIGNDVYVGLAAAQAALATFVPDSLIDELASSQYDAFMREHPPLSPREDLHRQLVTIVDWLAKHNPSLRGFSERHIEVIDDVSTVNAWCMPGMKMAVFTGLLERLNYDSGLVAAVLAHEMAHAELGHGYSQVRTALLGNAAFTAVLGQTRTTVQTITTALGGHALSTLTMAYVSRDDEDEADERAIHILRAAGYDPSLLATALLRLDRSQGTATTGL